jgi:nicotinate-nucleotide adenylyltransferase
MSTKNRKVGILPGVFDPVHDGHISFGIESVKECGLDKVFYLPEKNPHGKPDVSSIESRISGLADATKENKELEVLELRSSRFSVDETMPELLDIFADDRMVLMIGSDSARTICCWPGVEKLLKNMDLAVGLRGLDSPELIEKLMAELIANTGVKVDFSVVKSAHPHLSSTLIRQQAFAT